MSMVSTVVVVHDGYKHAEIKAHLELFRGDGRATPRPCQFRLLKRCDDFGGGKCAEADVLVGAFNFLPTAEFLEHVRSYPWDKYTKMSVTIMFNGDSVHTWEKHAEPDTYGQPA